MIGVVARENAAEQIKQYQKFTVNISDETSMMKRDILKINCLPQPISWEMDISAFIAIWTSV